MRRRMRLKAVLLECVPHVLVGTVYYVSSDPLEHKAWVDAFYISMTVTTRLRRRLFSASLPRLRRCGVCAIPQ